jgi:ferredoxin-NADP reductase
MLSTPLSAVLGLVFVLIGAAAIWLIFEASRHSHDQVARSRRIQAHRIAGYLFIALFCFMTWLMLMRLKDVSDELSLRPMLHILIAMVLAPLFLIKVLVARYYKSYTSVLVPLGLTIFTLGFVLIASTAGPYLLRRATIKNISLNAVDMGAARIDLGASESLMQRRCSRCHNLERIAGARKDARGWLATINRMRALPGSGISEADARTILSYLVSENSIDSSNTQGVLAVGRGLVDTHCNRCHALDRAYQSVKSPAEWNATVTRMVSYAKGTEGFFKPGEAERIIKFLSTTQTPGAVQARSLSGQDISEVGGRADRTAAGEGKAAASNRPTIVVGVLIAVIFGALVWSRAKSTGKAMAIDPGSSAIDRAPATLVPAIRKPVILQLVRTEKQTHDSVSLRFRVAGKETARARPGQFFTFDWLLDGQKLARSYSISSSPTQTGFVEIAVKKQPEGRVSRFLNERAAIGLTVEARGPLGRFCFQEHEHKRIALFAGGSGITPLISILRYIDDLCLDTKATLFYSVRAPRDIIFERELEILKQRLPNFKLVIVVTKPDADWTGPTARINRELVIERLGDVGNLTCFLCGPEAFMDHVKDLLISLGVDTQSILQERFGGKTVSATVGADAEAPIGIVDFAKSGKRAAVFAGQSLLEVAEANGIEIPYSCRQGQCGTCAARLLQGETQMDREDGLDPALKAQGYVLTCVARATGEVRLDA